MELRNYSFNFNEVTTPLLWPVWYSPQWICFVVESHSAAVYPLQYSGTTHVDRRLSVIRNTSQEAKGTISEKMKLLRFVNSLSKHLSPLNNQNTAYAYRGDRWRDCIMNTVSESYWLKNAYVRWTHRSPTS